MAYICYAVYLFLVDDDVNLSPLFQLLSQSSVSVSHKDIAARQAGSSIFPWQDQAHSRPSQDAMETPLKRRGTSLWEAHEETPIKARMSSTRVAQSPSGSSQQMEQLNTINQGGLFIIFLTINIWCCICSFLWLDNLLMISSWSLICTVSSSELRGRVSELERNLSTQEKEIRSQASKLQELQTQLNQARKELTERDRDLTKTRHELTQATDRHQQVESKVDLVVQRDFIIKWYVVFVLFHHENTDLK